MPLIVLMSLPMFAFLLCPKTCLCLASVVIIGRQFAPYYATFTSNSAQAYPPHKTKIAMGHVADSDRMMLCGFAVSNSAHVFLSTPNNSHSTNRVDRE